ncbi:MAG: alpha/beta hydrolase [Myxococcota bacterium]
MRFILVAALLATTPALSADIKVNTEDGQTLHAVEQGRGSHGVLLLHDQGRTHSDWTLFISKLESKGYRVLAIDLRGHGESASILDTEPDWANMPADVTASLAHLRKSGVKQVSVVGAGLGANLAIELAARDESLASVVLLSPGLNIQGFKPSGVIAGVGDKPLLLAAAKDDRRASSTVKYLEKQTKGPTRAMLLNGVATGTNLLDENPNLEDGILSWLAGNYTVATGLGEGATLRTGEVDANESQGKRYGEK